MGPDRNPQNVFTAMHHKATGELLHLMDGLYLNIEDGLFEFAYRHEEDEDRQRACFDLMREFRYRRSNLIQSFAKRMQRGLDHWMEDKTEFDTEYDVHLDQVAQRMSEKCSNHFRVLLGQIAERTANASGRDSREVKIPISPYQVAYNFLSSCRRACSSASCSIAWATFTVTATVAWKRLASSRSTAKERWCSTALEAQSGFFSAVSVGALCTGLIRSPIVSSVRLSSPPALLIQGLVCASLITFSLIGAIRSSEVPACLR